MVFEGDGWSIIKDKPMTDDLVASHVACKPENSDEYDVEADEPEPGIMSWFPNEKDAICYYCGAPVPAAIQALIHLAGSF